MVVYNDHQPLGFSAEVQGVDRLQRRTQPLILFRKRQRQRGKLVRIGGEVFAAQRHERIVSISPSSRQKNSSSHAIHTGFLTSGTTACDHSRPSSSKASWVAVRHIASSWIGGHAK